jgi:host factor-I protein
MSELEDTFLTNLFENKQSISIYLVNGIRLNGYMIAFDKSLLILVKRLTSRNYQLIYRHAIATIQPELLPEKHTQTHLGSFTCGQG